MTDSPIIFAYEILGKGDGVILEGEAISRLIKDDALAWVHLDGHHPATRAWLEQEVSYLDHIIIEALLEDATRPQMSEHGEGMLLILRGVNLNESADPEDMVSVRVWIDPHRIISIELRKLMAVRDIAGSLQVGKGFNEAGAFVSQLIWQLLERMNPVLSQLNDGMDTIEEALLEAPHTSLRHDIVHIRKQSIVLRRHMAPQREAIMQVRNSRVEWLSEHERRDIQESYGQISRIVEDLDMVRERAQVVKDELANMLSERLNKNMYILSIISAIFLPLGFLTGLFGINVGGMPGADNPLGFTLFVGVLLIILMLQIMLFRKMKWM